MGLRGFLDGTVNVRAESAWPERILNICSAGGIRFWNVKWEDAGSLTFCLTRRDFRTLRHISTGFDGTLSVAGKAGAPFFIARFRRRYALAAGLAAAFFLLFTCSFFVWDFDVEGNDTVSEETILRALEKEGVTFGTFGLSIDPESLKNHVLLDIPELSYMTVNVYGCRAYVIVRERTEPPEVEDEKEKTNVVASKAGLVTRVELFGGHAEVMADSTVTKGQLLISGVADYDTRGMRVIKGYGNVWARTWYSLAARGSSQGLSKEYTGREKTRFSLLLGSKRIKLYGSGSISYADYDKITTRDRIYFPGGIALPLAVERETYREFVPTPFDIPEETLRARAESALTAEIEDMLSEGGSISSAEFTHRAEGAEAYSLLTAECLEQIGRTEKIPD